MRQKTRISARVSASTKRQLDRYSDAHGLKQSRLVEEALLHHLQALRELTADLIIASRIVVSRDTGERILERLRNPRPPTPAMKKLFAKE